MSWKGDLLKAGIESDGKNITLFAGGLKCTLDDANSKGLKIFSHYASLADDAYYDLPDAKNGLAIAWDGTRGGMVSVSSAGACVLLAGTAAFDDADTDTNLCIFDNGTNARVRNRSGGTLTVFMLFLYF